MKTEYLTDEEIDTRLKYIYKVVNKLLKTRTKGAEQYEKYQKVTKPLKSFVIEYEKGVDKR